MKKILFAGLAAIGLSTGAASAATIANSFDAGAQGWTLSGGSLTWQSTGGNGGGYIQIKDTAGGYMQAASGSSFLGDLSAYNGGTLSLDAIQTNQAGGSYIADFGKVTLQGGGLTATLDIFTNDPTTSWQTGAASFDAASWGLSETDWTTLLSNVTGFNIEVESWFGVSETVGLDNIKLQAADTPAVPLPAGGLLLLSSLGLMGLRHTRHR